MDFIRTEILSSDQLSIADWQTVTGFVSRFDEDSDLLVSINGCIITPKKPIENYQWMEVEIENLSDNIVDTIVVDFYSSNNAVFSGQRVFIDDSPVPYGHIRFKVPNVGRIEKIQVTINNITVGQYIAIKSIIVVNKTIEYQKVSDSNISTTLVDGVGGWVYDAPNDRWILTFVTGTNYPFTVNSIIDEGFVNAKIHCIGSDAIDFGYVTLEDPYQHSVHFIGTDIEIDFDFTEFSSGAVPKNFNLAGNFNGTVYLTLRHGNFALPVSVFGGIAPQIVTPSYTPVVVPTGPDYLNLNNVWNGTQVYNGNIIVNAALILTGFNGFLKATAGVIAAVGILSTDVAGLGTAAVQNVGFFLQKANDLSDLNNVVTARANLGLGTMAVQNANAVAITGGNIQGTTLGGQGGILSTGEAGFKFAPVNDTTLAIGAPSSTNLALQGIVQFWAPPTTATSRVIAYYSNLTTFNAVYTLTDLIHYSAVATNRGASSTITNVYGFKVETAVAAGSNNYGFHSTINAASNTWQFFGLGTAFSFFGGEIGIINAAASDRSITVGKPSSAAVTLYGYYAGLVGPSTATSQVNGFYSSTTSAAVAYTLTALIHYHAAGSTKGAGSTITSVYGFYVPNIFAVGTNNMAFRSDVNIAANTWALYMAGTAQNYIGGNTGLGSSNPSTDITMVAGNSTGTNSTQRTFSVNGALAATTTVLGQGYHSQLTTAAAAFTLTQLIHFSANGATKGAGSTITSAYGFYAFNGLVQGTNNYGYYSDINAATNTYQLYMIGTAPSLFGAAVIEKEIAVTYSASMTINAQTGNEQIISVTDAVAHTINAPTNPAAGQYLEITIRNATGGAIGAATWNAAFKMTAWVQPATATSRTIIFRYNGTNWIEKGRTAADVPN